MGLQGVPRCYKGLQRVTRGTLCYKGLPDVTEITRVYRVIQGGVQGVTRWLQGVSGASKLLHAVKWGYNSLKELTRSYMELQRV